MFFAKNVINYNFLE